ncbi:hypothetical protein [Lysinibacillus sp. LZ02]|uniref:hypothetical protein n=1 Tax=Lysinibacillus sp. LZ02 TaxID=3420668 RepID=UPI003D35AD30
MLAEIYHKIADDGRNLSDRLEDQLTGDFFGVLRYIPFERGLFHVLELADFGDAQSRWRNLMEKQKGYSFDYEFWQREQEGELDLLLYNDDVVIGIEVKYLSGLSSEDVEPVKKYQESQQQLVRYVKMLERKYAEQPAFLLFLAPFHTMNYVKKSMQEKYPQLPVPVGFLCWEDIHTMLQRLPKALLSQGEQLMVHDLERLLAKKGLKRFIGFQQNLLAMDVQQTGYQFQATPAIALSFNWPQLVIQEGDYYEFKR